MPEPILTTATPTPIINTPQGPAAAPNGATEEPFGNQMEHMLSKAFATVHPDKYKMPAEPKPGTPEPPKLPDSRASVQATEPAAKADESKPPAKAAQWKEVNEERARLKKENEELVSQREKWKTWETERGEYETVKKRNEELTKIMQEVALERLPEFKKHFDDRRNTALAIGQQIVGEEHSAALKKIAQLPDGDFRNQLIKGLSDNLEDYQKMQLGNVLTKFSEINYERNAALQQAPEHLKTYQQQQDQQRAQRVRQFDQEFKEVVESWSGTENGIPLFQMKEGDETHNAEVKTRLETAKNILNLNLSANQLVKAALWSSAAPGLLRNQLKLIEELNAVKAENEQLKSGGPDLKSGGYSSPTSDTPDDFGTAEGLQKRLSAAYAGK